MSDEQTKILNDDKLDLILAEIRDMKLRLNDLEQKVDARLRETRPIWEAAIAEIKEQSKVIRSLERRFDVFAQDLMKIRGDILSHEDRIEDLEKRVS